MTIEEKARKEYPYITPSDGYECHAYNEAAKDGFIAGANWMFENVVKRLKNNAKDFSENADELIKQFEDAMEE